jgi:hypothetical protein
MINEENKSESFNRVDTELRMDQMLMSERVSSSVEALGSMIDWEEGKKVNDG